MKWKKMGFVKNVINTNMKKEEVKRITETLKRRLAESEEKWDSKIVSHAHIVGYLMGSIEYAIRDLEAIGKK